MLDLDWKAWTALWGAGLSTLLAVLNWFDARPIWTFEHDPKASTPHDTLAVRITSNSVRPVQITRICLVRIKGDPGVVRDIARVRDAVEDAWLWTQIANSGRLFRRGYFPVFVGANDSRVIRINTLKDGAKAIVILWWHRFWLLPIRLPMVILASGARAKFIAEGAISRGESR